MGFWAGIKHALNSTLGTEDFIPLDKLIKGQRTLAASDTTIAVLVNTNTPSTGKISFTKSFVPKAKGVVRIKVDGYGTRTDEGYVSVAENGKQLASLYFPGGTRETISIDISVSKNSIYTFSQNSYARVYNLSVGAQIVDGSLFEIQTV